jgi:hypothetical protein
MVHGKIMDGGTSGRRVSCPAQNAALVSQAQMVPFNCVKELKFATNIPGLKCTTNSRLKEVKCFPRNIKCHLAFAGSIVGRHWNRVEFFDGSTFSSANDDPILVHRPRGQRNNS